MGKAKRVKQQRAASAGGDLRSQGLRSFQSQRFDQAIQSWTPLAPHDPAVARALAEAYFRRAITNKSADPVADLRQAHELAPDNSRYQFHLGRMLHLQGDFQAAAEAYGAVLAKKPAQVRTGRLLALAILQQDPTTDLNTIPALTDAVRQWAAPVVALLHKQSVADDGTPLGRFWAALALIMRGDPAAAELLHDERSLPAAKLHALRRYYRGVAAAQAGQTEEAVKHWAQVAKAELPVEHLAINEIAALYPTLLAQLEQEDLDGAIATSRASAELRGSPVFDEVRISTLDRGAHRAAAAGNWAEAVSLWSLARQILSRTTSSKLGSPAPLLHNLALAYEKIEDWESAADTWRALLRTKGSRSSGSNEVDTEAARQAWVRKRVITCYRNAGRPDEAVTVFRQMVKAEPNNLALRIELADALLANEQDRAAENEVKRVLERDPEHPDALYRYATTLSTQMQYAESEAIMLKVVAQHPKREDLRRGAAGLFLSHGVDWSSWGRYDLARQAFVQGEKLQPDNPLFPLNQARMCLPTKEFDEARRLIERTLEITNTDLNIWMQSIETWAYAKLIDDARALIARFEREFKPDAPDYGQLGEMMIRVALPPPSFSRLAQRPPPLDENDPWVLLGQELVAKGAALNPTDVIFLRLAGIKLSRLLPKLALTYFEAALQLSPDDPDLLIGLGMVQGQLGDLKTAKATLRKAEQIARRQKRYDLEQQAQSMRSMVGTPMLDMMLDDQFDPEAMLDMLDEFDMPDY